MLRKTGFAKEMLTLFPHGDPPLVPEKYWQINQSWPKPHVSKFTRMQLPFKYQKYSFMVHQCTHYNTHHLLHQIFHNEALLLCANIGHPHPTVIQFIVNNKHVPFKEAGTNKNRKKKEMSCMIWFITTVSVNLIKWRKSDTSLSNNF